MAVHLLGLNITWKDGLLGRTQRLLYLSMLLEFSLSIMSHLSSWKNQSVDAWPLCA